MQVQQLISIIYDTWGVFVKEQHCYLPYCVKSSRSAQEPVKTHRMTAYDQACFLTVATFKTIYEGFFKRRSVTNTANFFHSSSDWGKQRKTERGRGEEEVNVKEEDREREQSTTLIYVYWFTSLPPHWFQCLLHPFRFRFIWREDIQPGPNKRSNFPLRLMLGGVGAPFPSGAISLINS